MTAKGPGFLWAPSITPRSVIATSAEIATVPLLGQSNFTQEYNSGTFLSDCWTASGEQTIPLGPFSPCAGKIFAGNLLQTIWGASTNTFLPRFDNLGMRYYGRSYGAGAVVGVSDTLFNNKNWIGYPNSAGWGDYDPGQPPLLGYEYPEAGFQTSVSCSYNDLLDWNLELGQTGNATAGIPSIYFAIGYIPPDNHYDFYSVWGLKGSDNITALGVTNSTIAIVAGSNYPNLTNVQCTVSFLPSLLLVSVNWQNQTTFVTPSTKSPNSPPNPDFNFRGLVMGQLRAMSTIETTLYGSSVGDALMGNMVDPYYNSDIAAGQNETLLLEYIAQSFKYVIDDLIILIGSEQIAYAVSR
ncbi:hypothetical protein G7Y89_g10301 [Cudoniella acicularis]|uniref:Uncharacterized protein n=1 Tax=Cudoniella acicularis TaxID=354080 RepID=A0A8H4VZ70_9HELO|nr:hypothetical protein G7Y89_g10301 [Cudoniella acicularis]